MPSTIVLTPIAPGEIETICFDYGMLLQDGPLTVTSVLSIACTVLRGTDASASSRIIALPVISESRETGVASSAVLQQFGNMLDGVTYLLQCTAVASDGQRLILPAHIMCVQIS